MSTLLTQVLDDLRYALRDTVNCDEEIVAKKQQQENTNEQQ